MYRHVPLRITGGLQDGFMVKTILVFLPYLLQSGSRSKWWEAATEKLEEEPKENVVVKKQETARKGGGVRGKPQRGKGHFLAYIPS